MRLILFAFSPFIRYTMPIRGNFLYPIDFAPPIMHMRKLDAQEKVLTEGEREPHRGHSSTTGNNQGPPPRVRV